MNAIGHGRNKVAGGVVVRTTSSSPKECHSPRRWRRELRERQHKWRSFYPAGPGHPVSRRPQCPQLHGFYPAQRSASAACPSRLLGQKRCAMASLIRITPGWSAVSHSLKSRPRTRNVHCAQISCADDPDIHFRLLCHGNRRPAFNRDRLVRSAIEGQIVHCAGCLHSRQRAILASTGSRS